MLRRLTIRNYALIDSLDIELPGGLIIITGETGAGKSIMLGALSLLLGGKGDVSALKDSSKNCVVEGEFELDGEELILRRVISPAGRTRNFINDEPANLGELVSIASRIIDIHAQHQHLLLTDSAYQMQVVDYFAGTRTLLEKYRGVFSQLQKSEAALEELDANIARIEGEREYRHIPGEIPVLKLHEGMGKVLQTRNIRMQITRRFDADSLFDLMPMRVSSYLGATQGVRYRLDDYTRFPVMEDVVREYVAYLRVRSVDGKRVLKVVNQDGTDFAWSIKGEALALLDGVPVRDHNRIINMDPLLIKEIQVYPRQIVLNYFVFDGVVKFNTYKGDMGGLQMGGKFSVIPHRGVQYPLAFLGDGISGNSRYPNYNSTLYWNPIVEIGAGEAFEFSCPLPKYKGEFLVVVEGVDSDGKSIYREVMVSNK